MLALTAPSEGKCHNILEWEHCRVDLEGAARLPQKTNKEKADRESAVNAAKQRQEHLDKAVALTPASFYEELRKTIADCEIKCEVTDRHRRREVPSRTRLSGYG